jgi:hypothetical protein
MTDNVSRADVVAALRLTCGCEETAGCAVCDHYAAAIRTLPAAPAAEACPTNETHPEQSANAGTDELAAHGGTPSSGTRRDGGERPAPGVAVGECPTCGGDRGAPDFIPGGIKDEITCTDAFHAAAPVYGATPAPPVEVDCWAEARERIVNLAEGLEFNLADAEAVTAAREVLAAFNAALRGRGEEVHERELDEVMQERDRAQDVIAETHRALGGDGDWCARVGEQPPNTGDLHVDLPVLAAELKRELDFQAEQNAAGGVRLHEVLNERDRLDASRGEEVVVRTGIVHHKNVEHLANIVFDPLPGEDDDAESWGPETWTNADLRPLDGQRVQVIVRKIGDAPMTARPTIVCLCGSTRFIETFAIKMWELERSGVIALGCTLLPSSYCPVDDHFAEHEEVKEQCDELHKRKIDLADEILVLNVGGYIGDSTRSEIEYAEAHGKPVRWLEPPVIVRKIGEGKGDAT